ncbi:hypothetical protein [Marinobacter alkaliphilus]|uniref:Uncharacterized protein n=1 Tax=Marinobacter alkaliphilus TaxID=254719 RepID=A0ABZ3E8K0_9GAMM
MLGFEISSAEAVKRIKEDQQNYGLQRSGLLASMHGAFQYDAEVKGDHVAFRACVLIRRAMPVLVNV